MKPAAFLSPARVGIVVLTLVALALGGATQLWEQAIVVALTAAVIFIDPPRRSLGLWPNGFFLAVLVLALAAFLPASWLFQPTWRHRLIEEAHLDLVGTRTPQPWLTAQACCLLFAGLVWAYYLLAQEWSVETRSNATRLLVLGVAVLGALAVAAFCLGFHVPYWYQEENRGWFPNRNQTADVLAVCGVVNYVLIFDALRKGQASIVFWLGCLVVIGAALVVSYSRAGILLFFGGIVLWHCLPNHRRHTDSMVKWTTLSVALVFVLLSCFLLFGGHTVERFQSPSRSLADTDFRWSIQEDALRFSLQSPVLGVGLGNFEPLFAPYRQASVNAGRAVHPESDWLWAACELGWFAPIIFGAAVVWWVRRCFPFEAKPGESLRRGLAVAGILFILHGLVDVAGHRVGSLWVGLLVFSLALPPAKTYSPSRAAPWVFRGLAAVMLMIAGWWLASTGGAAVPPTTAKLARLQDGIDEARSSNQLVTMEKEADAALGISPLDWHLYFQRAYAETFQPSRLRDAGADFLVARVLESKWVKPCFDEGLVWLEAGQPDLCLDAWGEALRRATPEEIPQLYHDMVSPSVGNEIVHDHLKQLAAGKIEYQLIFLQDASSDETKQIVADILSSDSELSKLSTDQRAKLFDAWWARGDRVDLIVHLTTHPDWIDAGWRYVAQSYADEKDFQRAWETVTRYGPPPVLPKIAADRPLDDLEHAFYGQSDNLAAGITLYFAQSQAGKTDGALATLHAIEKIKGCPKYVFYLEAQTWAAKKQWEQAWEAWRNFDAA